MNDTELWGALNNRIAEHCFNHGAPLIQFAIVHGTAATGSHVVSVVYNDPVYVTDDWYSWSRRCMAGGGP